MEVTTRWCFKLPEKAGRGGEEVGSDQDNRVYGTVADFEGMIHRLSRVESGEGAQGGNASTVLCYAGSRRCWGRQ